MPIPKKDVFQSVPLTNFSLAYKSPRTVNMEILPFFPVKKDTGKIFSYGADNLIVVNALRAQNARSNEVGHTLQLLDHYNLKDHVLHTFVDREEKENADAAIKPKEDATAFVLDRIDLIRETSLASVMSDAAILTQNVTLAGTDQWSDYTNSDPIDDMQTGIDAVFNATGLEPNTLFFSREVMMTLIHHPKLQALATGAVVVTADVVMQLLKKQFPFIEKVIVASAIQNTAGEGQTKSLSGVWGKNAWVLYIAKKPGLRTRTFGWTYGRSSENRKVLVIPEQKGGVELIDREADMVRVKDKYDQKLVDVECAYLIKNAVA